MTYFGNVNPELLNWAPLSARRVLEIGCGEGAFAAAYKARNPTAHYTGVEIHPASAAIARERLDTLFEGGFDVLDEREIAADGLFDLAVMGDVLEHLPNPWDVLRKLHRLLTPDGHLVVSVPNVSHWSVFSQLFRGEWPARDDGIFDRTHLRFFTLSSYRAVLAETGYALLRARGRQVGNEGAAARAWLPRLADSAETLGLDREAFLGRAQTLQYVVGAGKQGARLLTEGPLRLHVSAWAPRLLDVRTRLPAQALSSEPGLTVTYAEKTSVLPPAPVDQPKILVIQRPGVQTEDRWRGYMAGALAAGWLVVAEQDDHPALMAAVHRRETGPADWVTAWGVHAVQTSTPPLAESFREHNPEVAVFPNAVFELPPFPERSPGPARIFYGALNREGFSAQVAAALAPAIEAHPEMDFVVVHDRAFFEALPTARKQFQPVLGYDSYLAEMARCDIVLAPLEGGPGESFKSDVKFLEAARSGAAMIASPTVYAATIRDGVDGLIAPELADWSTGLARLAEDFELRRRLARSAGDYVRRERMFAGQVAMRRDWYRNLWRRRDDLNRDLNARWPALRGG